jgi:hypothetical protein
MKYDFVSPHIYPEDFHKDGVSSEPNSDYAVERVLGKLYWIKKYCPYPFMIGETGYTATDDAGVGFSDELFYPDVNGKMDTDTVTFYNQKKYLHDVIKMTRDCLGSGFSVWQYQESSNQWGGRDGYGLLRKGDPVTDPGLKKPACDEFVNYLDTNGLPSDPDPNGGQMPASYYDPFHFGTIPGARNGSIQDSITGDKIKGAYINGSVRIIIQHPIADNDTIWTGNYTYSHEENNHEGEFSVLPYDWYNGVVKTFDDFYISSVGASRLHYGGFPFGYYSDPASTIINGNTFLLNKNKLNTKNNIHDITLSASQNEVYEGFSTLEASNFIAE